MALATENKNQPSEKNKFHRWFTRKYKRANSFHLRGISDGDGDEVSEDSSDTICDRSMDINNLGILEDDLRVFVGSWNVGGRSPVGALAVDLDEWLDLKHSADIYVLGFQEIVPLKAKYVIGAEDQTAATNWNLLIGKTLNDKYGCPWLTPIINPIASDNYDYVPKIETQFTSKNQTRNTERDQSQGQDEKHIPGSKYKLIASKKMVGVFISVWMRSTLLKRFRVSGVKVCSVACGVMGFLGNKGSVSVSMTIEGTSFCFTAAHLASGEKIGNGGKRNSQVSEILRRTSFARLPQDGVKSHPLTIFGHDQIFWFGDLNYRLCLEDNLARQLIRRRDWRALQNFDQLQKELRDGGVFQGWREGAIEFAPTYKYLLSSGNRYSGGVPCRSGEKRRTPAWCDRILWYGKGVKQLSYVRSESKFSDHRPVSAVFSTQIVAVKNSNPMVFPTPPTMSSPTPSNTAHYKADKGVTSTLLSSIVNNTEDSPTHLNSKPL